MSQTNLKTYEFESYLLYNVKLFDDVLVECGEPPLLENENFSTFWDFLTTSNYLLLEYLQKKNNTIPLTIWIENDSLRIDIDGIPETFEWAKKHIDEDRGIRLQNLLKIFLQIIL